MNLRKTAVISFFLTQSIGALYAGPLVGYQITKQQDGSTPIVTRGKEYLFHIQGVGADGLPATSDQTSQVNLQCNAGPCVVTAPAASGPYQPNISGLLAVIVRFDSAPDTVQLTASKNGTASINGSLAVSVEPFPTSFNVALPNGLNVDAGIPFQITITALNGTTPITSFRDNVILRDDIIGDIQTISGALFINGVVSTTTVLTTGLWATHINHVTARNSVTYVGAGGSFASGVSQNIQVAPAAYDRIIILMPGENPTPGLAPGKTGTASNQTAGSGFNPVQIFAVDKYFNQLTSNYPPGLTISFNSSVGADTLPGATPLISNPLNVGGSVIFNPPLGARTITAIPSVNPTNTSQSAVIAIPGAVARYAFTIQPTTSASVGGTGADLVADVPFSLQITAYDGSSNIQTQVNGPVSGALSVTLQTGGSGPQWIDTNPATLAPDNTVTFVNGVANLSNVLITRNWHGAFITFNTTSVPTATSNLWKIIPGTAKQIVMTLRGSPGQLFLEGEYPGNSGTPPTITAGQQVQVEMRLTDGRWNVVSGLDTDNTTSTPLADNTTNPQKYIDSNIVTADFPLSGVISGGAAPMVTFRSSGLQMLRAQAGGSFSFQSQSAQIAVNPGSYARLMLVGPGEVAHPGIQTSLQSDGKVGTVTSQLVGVPFDVRVVATDNFWNPIAVAGFPQINFNFQDPDHTIVPAVPLLMGAASEIFSVTLESLLLPQIEVFDNVSSADPLKRQTISVNTAPGVVHHFRLTFTNPAQKEAGVPFNVTIQAEDVFDNVITSLSGYNVNLLANTGATTMAPEQVTLTNGIFNGNLTMFAATTTARIQMSNGSIVSQSPTFVVGPNTSPMYSRLLLLMPGEVMTPGMQQGTVGKTGTPTPTTVGQVVVVRAISCDAFFNPIDVSATVSLASDKYATFGSAQGQLANVDGHGEYSTTMLMRTAGAHTVTLSDVNSGAITPSVSVINGLVGTYRKLQVLAPGESSDPGTLVPTGKTAALPSPQKAGVPFTVTIKAVDDFWNVIPNFSAGDIALSANTPFVLFNPPNNMPGNNGVRPFINGNATRDVILGQQGLYNVSVLDEANLTKPGQTVEIAVDPGPVYVTSTPLTATAGQPFSVTISLEENGVPLAGYNGTVFLTANLASGGNASGQFTPDGSPKAYNMTNGQVTINDLSYSHVERIKIKITDNFNRVGFSNDIEVVPSGLKYRITVPAQGIAGPPANFPVTVELLELNQNTLVKNHDHSIGVEVLSAMNPTTDGAFTVSSVTLAQGVVTFQQSYTKAESIIIRITESATDGDPNFVIQQRSSNNINIKADGYKKLLLVAPGETHVPGVASGTGKTGNPFTRQLGVSFLVQVRGVDQYWNISNEFSGGQMNLTSNDIPTSLNANNPANQNAPLVNGESASNITLFTAGTVDVTLRDASNPAIGIQTVQLNVGGNVYDFVTIPAQEFAGPPTQFTMSIALEDSITGNIVTGGNHTVDLVALNPNGTPAAGVLGVTSAQLVSGVLTINNQSYSIAEDIIIRAIERTNNEIKIAGNSPIIHFIPRQVRYTFELPMEAIVNNPFTVTIRTLDQDTGTEVKNLNRTNQLEAYSAVTGLPATGVFVPSGPINIVNGVAMIQAVYNRTEPIFLRMTDNTPGGAPSAPTQAVFNSQSSVNIKPGPMASINLVDFDLQSNQTSSWVLVPRDASGNAIPLKTIQIEVTSIELPGQLLINGEVNGLTQTADGNGELTVLFAPSANANGIVELIVRDADTPNGFTKAVRINVNGFPHLPASAFDTESDLIPLNSKIFLDLSNIQTNGGTPRTHYRVDNGAWAIYDPVNGIDVFNQLKKYQIEWYTEICYDVACSNPVSQLTAVGAPNLRFVVTFVEDGKLSGFPSPFNPKKGLGYMTITYNLPSDSSVEIKIYDLFGQMVWQKDIPSGQNGGMAGQANNDIRWYGVNNDGVGVGTGGYILTVKPAVTGNTMKTKILVVK